MCAATRPQLLGLEPHIFPVSARLALQAKEAAATSAPTGEEWQRSRFEALEHYIRTTLNATERIRLKLENPLGVATRLTQRYRQLVANRRQLLADDFKSLDTIDEQLEAYQVDMRRDFRYQRNRVDNVLFEMMERGDRFFDETLRITRIFELINTERMRGEF